MKRQLAVLLLMILLTGCAGAGEGRPPGSDEARPAPVDPAPRGDSAKSAEEPPPAVREPDPPPSPRPDPVPPKRESGGRVWQSVESPDKRWNANLVGDRLGKHQLRIEPAESGPAWVVEPDAVTYEGSQFLWTPDNRLLFYRQERAAGPNMWLLADPVKQSLTPFAPNLLTGRRAGQLSFSADGKRVLATTGHCYGCNKPSELTLTTYVIEFATGAWTEVGVDVDARWDGDRVAATSQAPRMGYSGPVFTEWEEGHTRAIARGSLSVSLQVGATDRVIYKVYRAGDKPGGSPLAAIPARNSQTSYSTWGFWWGGAPEGPLRIEAWAEVRDTVPDRPEFRRENGRRWAVVYGTEVLVKRGDGPGQTLLLRRARISDAANGWAVDSRGRVLRTADGGRSWRDVSPAGLSRCAGRLMPQQAERFQGDEAVVAISCGSTDSAGKWSRESQQITIFRSRDAGRTWTESTVNTGYVPVKPSAVGFHTEKSGWVLVQPRIPYWDRTNEGALYRTADGVTWQKVSDTASGLPGARETTFLTPERGWTAGSDPDGLFVTEDGGRTWSPVELDLTRLSANSRPYISMPQFISPTEGFLTVRRWREGVRLGQQDLYATTDGGRTWEQRSTRDGERSPVFLTPQVGYVWEYELRTLFWTEDGGRTWQPNRWEINPTGIDSVQFVDRQRGLAVQGHLWVTADGGATWQPVYPQEPK